MSPFGVALGEWLAATALVERISDEGLSFNMDRFNAAVLNVRKCAEKLELEVIRLIEKHK